MAMSDTKGGRVSLTIGNQTYSMRASAKVMPARVSLKNDANQDGSGFTTVAAKLASLEMSFDRGKGLKWDESMILASIDATFVETDAGVTHLFTSGRWDGDPTIDTGTGEVTGMKIVSDQYQQI